ncbi:MAG: HAD family hydrolase [Bdellovibrionota bacterium]
MKVAAFFDVDQTLLAENSGKLYLQWMFQKGRVSQVDLWRAAYSIALHRLNRLDAKALARRAMTSLVGYSATQMEAECAEWFEKMVLRWLSPAGMRTVEAHKEQGHTVVLCSASTQFVCDPLVKHLSIDGALCTRLVVKDGHLTGEIEEPFCYGPGKREVLEKYARENDVDLVQSYFYSDSVTDLPALEAVGKPVVVNADRYLYREARHRAWPLLSWGAPQG